MTGRLLGAIGFMLFLRLVVWCWPQPKVTVRRSATHSPRKVLEGAYHLRS